VDLGKKKVSLLILTYNRYLYSSYYIPEILEWVNPDEHEVRIWDNGSTDETIGFLNELEKEDHIHVTYADKNYGVEAINFLAKDSLGEYVLKVDDDVEVPAEFVNRLVKAYEDINDPKLAHLSWNMEWVDGSNFALRKGRSLYREPRGTSVLLGEGEVLITYTPSKFLVNGACRLSRKDIFNKIKHPEGVLYGADYLFSKRTEELGYYAGYYHTEDLLLHEGQDTKEYRKFKDEQLKLWGAPKNP